ncbi:MAG: N-acetyltransferase [Thermoprotei archaeon]|nr:MAG: N-acetyltransferase [Thermoprotei archaeon]
MKYISPKAKIPSTTFIGEAVVLGPTFIGEECLIEDWVIIGHPKRKGLLQASTKAFNSLNKALDEESRGAKVGRGVIVRSGSVIYENVELGDYVETGHYVLIRENTQIGREVKVGSGTIIDGEVKVGDRTNIQSCAYLPPKTLVGKEVFIGPRAVITNDRYPFSGKLVETVVEDGVVIGANAVLVAGIRVGKRAVVAAGAVVTKSVEEGVVVAGCPAKRIMTVEEYEEKRSYYLGEA